MDEKSTNKGYKLIDEAARKRMRRWKTYRFVRYAVEGYDTSLPVDEIEKALTNHFSNCGKIYNVWIPTDPVTGVVDRCAYMNMYGDDVEEKVLALNNGSDVGGWKIVAKPSPLPRIPPQDISFGSTVPART